MKILGYIFIFYIGFYFYRLAENHNKNKWFFGIIGIVAYTVGSSIYVIYTKFFLEQDINEFNILSFSFRSFSIGLLSVFTLFHILSFIWSKKKIIKNEDIDKIGKTKD